MQGPGIARPFLFAGLAAPRLYTETLRRPYRPPSLQEMIVTGFRRVVLAVVLASACGKPEPPAQSFDLAAMRTMIEQKNEQFTRAHVEGDVATIDAMFTRDAKSFPPGAEAASGPAAIHDLTVEYLKAGIKEFREETTDVYGNGELLVDQGNYVITYGPDNTVERGKYLNVWRQEDGVWKIHANIWNSSPAQH